MYIVYEIKRNKTRVPVERFLTYKGARKFAAASQIFGNFYGSRFIVKKEN